MRMTVAAGGTARRNADLLADGNDDIVLQVHQQGGRVVSQFGREAIIGAGVGLVTSNADPSMITLPGPARFISIAVPRRLMRASAPRVEDLFLRPVPFANGMLRVLARYVDFADDDPSEWTAELRHSVATHIHDLCALIIGAGRDATVVAERRGLRAARMKAVKADIAENLGDIDLRATSIALRQGITPRYVHKLFEDEGVTLSEFVRGQRMALVHRMLSDPRHVHRTIGSIAIEAGFGDLSTFNRDFRRQVAATPSEVRGSRKA
jgi:AraC-like DNA-binding protein